MTLTITSIRDITKIATAGTLFSPACNLYILSVKDTSNVAIDLRAEDDATNYDWDANVTTPDTYAVETVEAIVSELNPMAYFTVDDASGVMYLIMDQNVNSASDLQARVRKIGIDPSLTPPTKTAIGPNDIDISGSTVEAATGMTFTV